MVIQAIDFRRVDREDGRVDLVMRAFPDAEKPQGWEVYLPLEPEFVPMAVPLACELNNAFQTLLFMADQPQQALEWGVLSQKDIDRAKAAGIIP
jgi:hypothetical protein